MTQVAVVILYLTLTAPDGVVERHHHPDWGMKECIAEGEQQIKRADVSGYMCISHERAEDVPTPMLHDVRGK